MLLRSTLSLALLIGTCINCNAQDKQDSKPAELDVIKGSIGVWDAEFQVWSQGPNADPMKFTGVETNTAFGEYWIASNLVSNFMGQTMTVHSIIGFDIDQNKLVGKTIDYGPYAAKMEGKFDNDTKTVHWVTKVKDPNGNPIEQNTSITQTSDDERILVLSMPGKKEGELSKFMEIKYTKRK